jgi:hypothetical protein
MFEASAIMRYVTRGGTSALPGVRRMHSCFVLLQFGSARRVIFELHCAIYITMGTTKTSARQAGYVPRKVAEEIRKRAAQTRKAERDRKRARKAEKIKTKVAKWQAACVPPDIRRPWNVFHDDVEYTVEDDKDVYSEALVTYREDLHAVQELGALRAYQALPACRRRVYNEISLQELSAFAAWSATSGLADVTERVAAWTGLDANLKASHVPHDWRALLAKDPTWHVFIADLIQVKEEAVEEPKFLMNRNFDEEDGDEEEAVVPERRGIGRKSTPGAADDDRSLHKPIRKRPAAASTARPALGQASGVAPAAGTSAKAVVAGTRRRPKGTQGATDDDKNHHKPVRKRTAQRDQRRVDKLAAKYPWGREGGPPPATETEQQELAEQIRRLRIEAGNFARPKRVDGERLAHANTMLEIMRGKARDGFGGGKALAKRGLSLNRSAGLALVKRAKKITADLEAHFDPEGAPSVQIEEGIALWDASAD